MAPTHAPLTRASLDSSKYSSVNVFLKSIKLHTRTLSALFAQHATELAVLERIYYLNNNQHRPALFWQRVVEARRYSRRLKSLDVLSLVDGLRRTFHGDVADARWGLLLLPVLYAPLMPPAKLETTQGSMDTLPIRILSQIFPRAYAHLHYTARQSAFSFSTPSSAQS